MRLLLVAALLLTANTSAQDAFAKRFKDRTIRVDLEHSGTASEERLGFVKARLEGAWAGSKTNLLDASGNGAYRFLVRDPADKKPIFSRGYCSIYGEWETTGEAKVLRRSFQESVRFPEPLARALLSVEKREPGGAFVEIFACEIDPSSRAIDRSPPRAQGEVTVLAETGPAAERVDLLVAGDGYTAARKGEFEADAKRLLEALFATEPFKSRAAAFNVRLLHVAARESGIGDPRSGLHRSSPLGLSYNAFDSDRYMLTFENEALQEALALVRFDTVILLGDGTKYGGGGIYELYATCAARAAEAPYVFVHEFGHSFGGLADEYYTSQVAYEELLPSGFEPWEPNITALLDPKSLKWGDLVLSETPLPTPWNQTAFDRHEFDYQAKRRAMTEAAAPVADMDGLMARAKATTAALLGAERHKGAVGALEGAGYKARGLYRPEIDCIMFSRSAAFCRVCERALRRAIDVHAKGK